MKNKKILALTLALLIAFTTTTIGAYTKGFSYEGSGIREVLSVNSATSKKAGTWKLTHTQGGWVGVDPKLQVMEVQLCKKGLFGYNMVQKVDFKGNQKNKVHYFKNVAPGTYKLYFKVKTWPGVVNTLKGKIEKT